MVGKLAWNLVLVLPISITHLFIDFVINIHVFSLTMVVSYLRAPYWFDFLARLHEVWRGERNFLDFQSEGTLCAMFFSLVWERPSRFVDSLQESSLGFGPAAGSALALQEASCTCTA